MLNNNVKISIVTPSFNQGEYLEHTIDSVLSQNYRNLEYIIMDGGSTDNSVEIIKKYEKHLKYWVSEKDSGQSDAINKGLKLVTGDVFNWLCSDDYLENGTLKLIGEAFSKPNIHFASGNIRVIEDSNKVYIKEGTKLKDTLEESLALSINIQPATFFRTQFYRESQGINKQLHYFMDKEFLMKYLFAYGQGHFSYIDSTIANYRIHKMSKTFQEMDPELLNPSSKFKIDNNSIYYSIAKQINENKIAETILSFTDNILPNYCFSPIHPLDKTLVNKTLNHYLLHEAQKWFYKGEQKKTAQILRSIDKKHLNAKRKKDFYYLYKKTLFSFIK